MSTCYDTSFCRICCSSVKTTIEHIPHLSAAAAAMATSRQPANKRNRALEQFLPVVSSDICPYWPSSPAFDTQRMLLRRLIFVNSGRTKYVSVGFYPASHYQPLVEFGAIRRGGSKSFILKDEHIDTLAVCLPKMLVSVCNGEGRGAGCVSGAFRLSPPKKFGSARLYFDTQYISLTILDLQYLARMFYIVQQQLHHYTTALPDVLSYVTSSVTSVTYVEPVPNVNDHIDYRHPFEELVTAV